MARRVTGLALWKPTGKSLAVVQVALDLRGEWPLLVRRVLYVVHERGLYPAKGKRQYDAVGNVLGRARPPGTAAAVGGGRPRFAAGAPP